MIESEMDSSGLIHMKQNTDILQLARDAGLLFNEHVEAPEAHAIHKDRILKFAFLLRAEELDRRAEATVTLRHDFEEMIDDAVAADRERIADWLDRNLWSAPEYADRLRKGEMPD
jgi:hypothetical protein